MNEQVEVGGSMGMITRRTFPDVAVWIWRHDFQAKLVPYVGHGTHFFLFAMMVSELRGEI